MHKPCPLASHSSEYYAINNVIYLDEYLPLKRMFSIPVSFFLKQRKILILNLYLFIFNFLTFVCLQYGREHRLLFTIYYIQLEFRTFKIHIQTIFTSDDVQQLL